MNERMWVRVGVELERGEVVNGSCACEGCVDQLRVVEDGETRASRVVLICPSGVEVLTMAE